MRLPVVLLGIPLHILLALPHAMAAEPTKAECVAADDAGQDLRQAGRLVQARERFAQCASASCPGVVRDDCNQRFSESTGATPTIVFEAKDPTGNDVASVTVTVDGQPFAKRLDGNALEVDPGEHRFTFSAEGYGPTTRTLVLREAEKARHELIVLSLRADQGPTDTRRPEGTKPTTTASGSRRVLGLALGGAGAVGLAVGAIFAFVAKSTYDHALTNECTDSDPSRCSDQGVRDGDSAHVQALVATVGLVGGSVLAASGAVVYFTAPTSRAIVAPTIGADAAGLEMRGTW